MRRGRLVAVQGVAAVAAAVLMVLALGGCGGSGEDESVSPRAVAVTLATSRTEPVESRLYSVGRLISQNTPRLASEIDARVTEVRVDAGDRVEQGQELVLLDTTALELARQEARAEISRLVVSIANEKRRVERYRDLRMRDVLPAERMDDAEAALATYQAAMEAAQARLAIVEDRLGKARVVAPVSGMVQERHVSVGDFAKVGMPLVTITDTTNLRGELPFPETVGDKLEPGQPILIESVVAPGVVVEARVDHIRPNVGGMSRAVVVIAHVQNPGPWRPEATIEGHLLVDRRPQAVVVPQVSVVRRPGREVVYVLDEQGSTVREQAVLTGERLDGWVEIREGLQAGQTVVADGAAYLVDGAAVAVQGQGE